MTYGYIINEYNNIDFIKQQQQALEDFSPIYDYSIDEIIIETENFTQLNNLVSQMEKGDRLVTCGYGLNSGEFHKIIDKLSKDIKITYVDRPADIIIHEMNICLNRINNRAKQSTGGY